jgi:hypothetical protein
MDAFTYVRTIYNIYGRIFFSQFTQYFQKSLTLGWDEDTNVASSQLWGSIKRNVEYHLLHCNNHRYYYFLFLSYKTIG